MQWMKYEIIIFIFFPHSKIESGLPRRSKSQLLHKKVWLILITWVKDFGLVTEFCQIEEYLSYLSYINKLVSVKFSQTTFQ